MSGPVFDAWYLPGVAVDDLESRDVGELTCRYPVPSPELVEAAVPGLRAARSRLQERSTADVVRAIDAAAARLADPADPLRVEAEAAVGAAVGYAPAMTRLVLDRMAADWRAGPLETLLAAELDDPGVLDEFRPDSSHRSARAYGPELAFQVFAGNVPGVAVTALVRTLLVKTPTLGKLASGQPVLPVVFARALHSVDETLGRALAITYWPGGAAAVEAPALDAADTVVVYGGEDAVAAYRERTPAGTRLVVHGPRFSVGLVGNDALREDPDGLARDVARATALFDQHGCVSPHAVWVEGGPADALDFAEAVADALETIERELPRGRISAGEASTIQQERAAAELRGHALEGPDTRVFSGDGTRWTVVYDAEPTFRPSCLNRFLRVHPVPALEDVPPLLAPVGHLLQSVAVAGAGDRWPRLAHGLATVGATRVTTFERLPWPPPHWRHDGRGPLRELLRWVDREP